MRAFNFSSRSLVSSNPSYENASLAGSLSPTGNSFRPIASPQPKFISAKQAQVVQPRAYPVPRANPVRVSQPVHTGFTPGTITAHPVLSTPSIRGIIGS